MTVVSKRLGGGPASLQSPPQPESDVNGAVPLPFDAWGISRYYQEDPDVYIAVNTIAGAVCGQGYEIVSGGEEDETLRTLRSRFEGLAPESTLMETLRQVVIHLNLLGNGYLELARDREDRPCALWWCPATDLRRLKDGSGYLQVSGGCSTEFNAYAPSAETRRDLKKIGRWRSDAHEIVHLKLPNPRSRDYGLPPAYTVAKDILADAACKDSNIALFQNGLCPDYAVVVRGGTLSEETAATVREYLQEAHRGPSKHHGFLVLEAASGAGGATPEIDLVPIQGKLSDMQWAKFRQLNIESKVRAFRVPMSKAGINQFGRLGEASSRGEDDTFKYQVVEPQQTMIEHMFTRMLRLDFEATDLRFRFKELDPRDEWSRAQTASLLAGGRAVLTVNEARALLGLSPVEGGDTLSTLKEGRADGSV